MGDWDHTYLLNHARPYAKLVVEIDAVAGAAPSRTELRELEALLKRYCAKPGGVTLRVDQVIPRHVARARTVESLALEYVDGPADEEAAFLYLIFYDTRLRGPAAVVSKPSFSPFPFPSIAIDRAYRMRGNLYRGTFDRAVLRHETCHALGLCAQASRHALNGHCIDDTCLMYSNLFFSVGRFLTLRNPWKNTALCRDCEAELQHNMAVAPKPNERFWRGYLCRIEDGYQVLGLPGFVYVHFGEPLAEPDRELTEWRQQTAAAMAGDDTVLSAATNTFDPWQHVPALARFSREPEPTLRELAQKLFERIAAALTTMATTDPAEARSTLSDGLIEAAAPFPAVQAALAALRQRIAEPAGPPAGATGG